MAYNEQLTNRVREAFEHLPNVEEKRMFRGIVFMLNGKMCVSVGDDKIMCRVDPALHDELMEKENCTALVLKGREYKGYLYVHEDVIKIKKGFDFWFGLAIDFNKRAKASVKKKKK